MSKAKEILEKLNDVSEGKKMPGTNFEQTTGPYKHVFHDGADKKGDAGRGMYGGHHVEDARGNRVFSKMRSKEHAQAYVDRLNTQKSWTHGAWSAASRDLD